MAKSITVREKTAALRRRYAERSAPVERRVGMSLGGAVLAMAEKRGIVPISVMGVPSKLALAVGATLLEANSSGATRRYAGAAADAASAIYSYEAVKLGKYIAGEDEDEDEDDAPDLEDG